MGYLNKKKTSIILRDIKMEDTKYMTNYISRCN